MDLPFLVPMQYWSLQHWTLLLSPVTSTAGCCFCFGSIPSFFQELFLHWSAVAYWAPIDLGSSSFGILSFCLFIHSWASITCTMWIWFSQLILILLQTNAFFSKKPPAAQRTNFHFQLPGTCTAVCTFHATFSPSCSCCHHGCSGQKLHQSRD